MKLNETVTGKVESARATANSFVVQMEGQKEAIFIARRIAAEDGYIHRSQFVGQTIRFTPTQAANPNPAYPAGGFLGNAELPLANVSTNGLLLLKQTAASNYQMAAMYKTAALASAE